MNKMPKSAEKVIREARSLTDMKVFAQAEGQWAIRILASEKMKSKLRSMADEEEEPLENDLKNNRREGVAQGNSTNTNPNRSNERRKVQPTTLRERHTLGSRRNRPTSSRNEAAATRNVRQRI